MTTTDHDAARMLARFLSWLLPRTRKATEAAPRESTLHD